MKKIKIGRWILYAISIVFLYFFIAGENGLIDLYKLRRKSDRLNFEIGELNQSIDSLTEEIDKLKNDTTFIEYIAREKLGMARKNEKIYKFLE